MHDWLKKNKKKVLALVGAFLMVSFLAPTMFNNSSGRNGPGAQIGTIGKTVLYEKDRHHADRMWKIIEGCYDEGAYKRDSASIARMMDEIAKVNEFKSSHDFDSLSGPQIVALLRASPLSAQQIQLLIPAIQQFGMTERNQILQIAGMFFQGGAGEEQLRATLKQPVDPRRYLRPPVTISPIYKLGDQAFVTQFTAQIRANPEFYGLLVKEAEQRGIAVSPDRIQTAITNEIKWDTDKLGKVDLESYAEAVHDFLMVQSLLQQVSSDVKFTKAQWDQYFIKNYRAERIDRVEYVVDELDPAHMVMPSSVLHPATQPTTAELELYAQFKDVDPITVTPSAKNVLGIGYFVPDRVKLQCLEVSRKNVLENIRKRIGDGTSRPPLPPGTDILGPYNEIVRQAELLLVKKAWEEYFKNKVADSRDFQTWQKAVMDKEEAARTSWESYFKGREGSSEVLQPWTKFEKETIESRKVLDTLIDPAKAGNPGQMEEHRPFPTRLPPGHPRIPSSAAPQSSPAAHPIETTRADGSRSAAPSAAGEQLTRPMMLSAEIGQAGQDTVAFAAATQPTTPPATAPAAAPEVTPPATGPAAEIPAPATAPTTLPATTAPAGPSVKQDEDDKIFKENIAEIVSKGLKSEIDAITTDIAEAIRRKMLADWKAQSQHNATYPDEVAKSIQAEFGVLPTFTQDPRWYRVDQLSNLTPEPTLPPEETPRAPDHPLPAGLGGVALQKAVEDAAPFVKDAKADTSLALHVWQPGEVIIDGEGNAYVFRLTDASPAHSKDPKDPTVIAQIKEDARIKEAYENDLKYADALVKRVTAGKSFHTAAMFDSKTPTDPAGGAFNASSATDHNITPDLLAETEKLVAEADANPNNPNPIGVLPVPELRRNAKIKPKVAVVQLVDVSLQVPKKIQATGFRGEAETVPVPAAITTVDQLRALLKPDIETSEQRKAASVVLKSYFTMDAVSKRLGYVADKSKSGS